MTTKILLCAILACLMGMSWVFDDEMENLKARIPAVEYRTKNCAFCGEIFYTSSSHTYCDDECARLGGLLAELHAVEAGGEI